MKENPFDDIWDEHQWESHINHIEQKTEQLREFLETTFGEENPRWYKLLKESSSEQDAIDAFIEEELMFEDAYFPDDDDWDDEDYDEDDGLFLDEYDRDDFDADEFDFDDLMSDDDEEDFDDGEDWKMLSEDYATTDYGSIENLEIYQESRELATSLLRSVDMRSRAATQDDFNLFISDVLQISAKIAAGYALGFEQDVLGGNIAYSKKALYAANRALNTLQTMRKSRIFKQIDYQTTHARLHELRNDVGVYVQELRERFYGEN